MFKPIFIAFKLNKYWTYLFFVAVLHFFYVEICIKNRYSDIYDFNFIDEWAGHVFGQQNIMKLL